MTDIDTLDPDTRALVFVGAFLRGWALMEHELNSAVAKSLGLARLQEIIVTRNIQLRDKLNILATTIDLSGLDEKRREHFKSKLKKIANYAYVRNMMAHDAFGPSPDSNGVQFLTIKARGSLEIPEEIWDKAKFAEAMAKVKSFRVELEALQKELEEASLITALMNAKQKPPTEGLFGLGLLSLQSLRFPDNPDSGSDQPTQKTEPQTPPSASG